MSNTTVVSLENRVSSTEMIMGNGNVEKAQAYANIMAGSNMVPAHFKGMNTDLCLVIAKALSMGIDPVAMCQEVFPVKGKMTYGAKLIIAMIHSSNIVEPRTYVTQVGNWDNRGQLQGNRFANEMGLGLRVGFKYFGDEAPTYGSTIFLADQTTRSSPLWSTDPIQQLTYLAAKRWSSIHLPAVTMGMMLRDEVEQEEAPKERDVTPSMDSEKSFIFESEEKVINVVEEVQEVQEVQADIEDVMDSLEDEIEVDINGEVFNPKIHTGSKLQSGAWRLNKAGRSLAAMALESKEKEVIKRCQRAKRT